MVLPQVILLLTQRRHKMSLYHLFYKNNLLSYQSVPYKYITGNWDDKQQISYTDYAVEPSKRTLPGTSHVYPWLTDDDFFQPSLIKLDYTLNRDCYFDATYLYLLRM